LLSASRICHPHVSTSLYHTHIPRASDGNLQGYRTRIMRPFRSRRPSTIALTPNLVEFRANHDETTAKAAAVLLSRSTATGQPVMQIDLWNLYAGSSGTPFAFRATTAGRLAIISYHAASFGFSTLTFGLRASRLMNIVKST